MDYEIDLVKASKTGDMDAFSEIVSIYYSRIYFLALKYFHNKHDAEDVVQETFVRVFQNLNKFDENKKFSTWIFCISARICGDILRKRKHRGIILSLDNQITNFSNRFDYYDTHPSSEITPENYMIMQYDKKQIQYAINKLSPKYQEVILLKYFHDFTLKEISLKLNIPISTVKTRLFRGRENLRKEDCSKELT